MNNWNQYGVTREQLIGTGQRDWIRGKKLSVCGAGVEHDNEPRAW